MRYHSVKMTENPTISVIIPVYSQAQALQKCLDSILTQTYQALEIILVNDAFKDINLQLITKYASCDTRIKVISLEENRGLFQARLTGFEASTGKYIAFVNSDDYISVDWFRKLLRQAEKTKSDIVVGEWCYDHNGEYRDYYNLEHFRINNYQLEGEQLLQEFMRASVHNFSWSVVWNKIYSRDLFNTCYPIFKHFSESHSHMLMWTDIVFSFALFAHAKKMTNVHGINYFHFKNSDSVNIIKDNRERNRTCIYDASSAIKFGKQILADIGFYTKYETEYKDWKNHGMSMIYHDFVTALQKEDYTDEILTAFEGCHEDIQPSANDISLLTTPLTDAFICQEKIKKDIVSKEIKYVSFDVFDTLISRPFYFAADLYELLSEKLNQRLSAYVNFRVIRELSERIVRQKLKQTDCAREEVTLDEIYGYIKEHYCFSPENIDGLKKYEVALELQYSTTRESGRELYELALESGKSVIILCDTYLPQNVISSILAKNGFRDYAKLYVSGETGFTKAQKSLYPFVQQDLGEINPAAFIHIGSNYQSDICNASTCGWHTGYLYKTTDLLGKKVPNHYTGESFIRVYRSAHTNEDYVIAFDQQTSIRSMTAIVANKLFDNPFVSIHPNSDYNADPRAVGYGTLGPHLLALCNWIYGIAKREHIGTIHFVARDGYLLKQAFEICGFPDIKTNYIRLSRKSLILADVDQVEDLYSLYDKIQFLTSPKKLQEYLSPIIPEHAKNKLEELFEQNGIPYEKRFENASQFYHCMNVYIDQVIDIAMIKEYKHKLKDYFSGIIAPGDYLFDIGYSGRPEAALSNLLGYPVGSLYVHKNGDIADTRLNRYSCPSEVFYQAKPVVTGVIREQILMELGPSTIGYNVENETVVPILEDYKSEYESSFVTSILQENALQFIKDYVNYFSDHNLMFIFQNNAMSAFLEDYLHFSKPMDRMIFASLKFETDIGTQDKISALDFWNTESQRIFTNNFITNLQQNAQQDLDAVIANFTSSLSWRLTAPLRYIANKLRSNRCTQLMCKGITRLMNNGSKDM